MVHRSLLSCNPSALAHQDFYKPHERPDLGSSDPLRRCGTRSPRRAHPSPVARTQNETASNEKNLALALSRGPGRPSFPAVPTGPMTNTATGNGTASRYAYAAPLDNYYLLAVIPRAAASITIGDSVLDADRNPRYRRA